MTAILVFAEKDETAFELLAKALDLAQGERVGALAFQESTEEEYFFHGAAVLYRMEGESESFAEDVSDVLHGLAQEFGYEVFLIASTKKGKEIAARLATRLGAGCVTDVIDLRQDGQTILADRYTLGGNCIATEEVQTALKVYAVLPYAFKKGQRDLTRKGQVVPVGSPPTRARGRIVERREKPREGVRLEEAERIVAVGKGLTQQEDLALIRRLAELLQAEIACSRPVAVDFHWLAEDRVIGLTGVKASPKLYLALGISGQIQHVVGVSRAKIIVAVNKSADAPIFKVSDYGIVGDLYQVVPRLIEHLTRG